MKVIRLLVILLLISSYQVRSQEWLQSITDPQNREQETTFFEIQDAFYKYWSEDVLDDGYDLVNGKEIKVPGWKQFKRWEWYWKNRVDPESGLFPSAGAYEELSDLATQRSFKTGGSSSGSWTSLGPTGSLGGYAGIGRLNCVAFHPSNSNVIYAGAATGGLWKSENAGSSWSPLGQDNLVLGVSDIVVIPNGNTETILIATGDRDSFENNASVGILKSTDGGTSWSNTGLSWTQNQNRRVSRIVSDPNDPNILYAATSLGVFKSINLGQSWTNQVTDDFIDLEIKPGDSNTLYASTRSGGKVYRTIDAGSNWVLMLDNSARRTELAVSANDPSIVYILQSNNSSSLFGVQKSTDSGATFTEVAGSSPNMLGYQSDGSDSQGQGWYDLCIAADPNNADVIYIGGINTWKSTDGGSNWVVSNMWTAHSSYNQSSAPVVHADKHFLAFQNGTSVLFECNDGGIYKTENGGVAWTDLSNGLAISQIYRIGVSQSVNGDVINGLQDNGTKFMDGGNWFDVLGGDGMECIIDPTNNNTQFGSLYYGEIYGTTNKWASSISITDGIGEEGDWVSPYVLDPNSNTTIYLGYEDVYRSNNSGLNWTKISSFNGDFLQSLVVAPSNSNVIYTATTDVCYRTSNGGTSWIDITGSLPVSSSTITYISVHDQNPDIVWVSMGQFNTHGVYQTSDGGNTWTNISSGLPSIPVNCVIQNKQNSTNTELYAATDLGIYVKYGSNNWSQFNTGLPNVVVNELEIRYNSNSSNSEMYAATWGRGLWKSPLPENTGGTNGTQIMVNGSAVTGSLSGGDEDWFYFDAESGTHTYIIETHSSIDMYLHLYSADQTTQLAIDDDGGVGLNSMISQSLSTGRYFVKVRGYNSSVTGAYSIDVVCTDCGGGTEFNPPRNLSVSSTGADYVGLSWDAPTSAPVFGDEGSEKIEEVRSLGLINSELYGFGAMDGLDSPPVPGTNSLSSYNIFQSSSENGSYSLVGNSTTTSYQVSSLAANTTYWYYVTAVYTNPNGESSASNKISGATGSGGGTSGTQIEVNGSAVSGSLSGGDEDWYYFDAESGNNTYVIETHSSLDMYMYLYQSDRTTQIALDDDSGVGLNSKISRALSAGRYFVKVRGYSNAITGSYSVDVVCSDCGGSTEFNPPRNLSVSSTGADYINLAWDAPTSGSVSSYNIFQSSSENGSYSLVGNVTATAHQVTGLAATTTYWYYVTAVYTSPSGGSNASNKISGTTGSGGGTSGTQIVVNGGAVSGSLSGGDEDWYYFDAASGSHTYVIETHSSIDMYMYLYQSDQTTQIALDDDGGVGLNSKISQSLSAGRYFVKVRGYSNAVTGSYSVDVVCGDCGGSNDFNPPRNLSVSSTGADYIALSWDAPTSGTVSSYNIFQSSSENGSYSLAGSSSTRAFQVTGLAATTTYWYYVTAVYTSLNGESNASNKISGTTGSGGGTSGTQIVVNGGAVSGSLSGGDEDWYYFDAESGSHTYVIETHSSIDMYMYLYQSDQTTQIALDDDGGVGLNSKISRSLSAGRYFVKLRGYSNVVTGSYSVDVVCSDCGGSTQFNPPRNLSVSSTGADYIDLVWDAPGITTASSYKVFQSSSENGSYSLVGSSATSAYQVTGLAANTSYWYYVTALYTNPNGESSASNKVSGTTSTGGGTSGTQIEVNGNAVSGSLTGGDEDWYYFDAENGNNTYVIETHGNIDLYMYLYQSDRTTLISIDDDGGQALNSKISRSLNGGRYFVKIRGYHTGVTGSYVVDVICNECGDNLPISRLLTESNESFDLLIYPNPTNGEFNVIINNDDATDLIIEMLNLSGQIVFRNEAKGVSVYNENIDASRFAKGVYYLKVHDGKEVRVEKVIVQ